MKAKFKAVVVSCLFAGSGVTQAQDVDYFGATPPGLEPVEFSFKNIVPDGMTVGNPTFSPDGREFYFTETQSMNIHIMKRTAFGWGTPERASFANDGRNYEPFITMDNKRIYFVSTRAPGSSPYNGRIWTSERRADGSWGEPQQVIERDTKEGFWFPTSPAPNTLYFGATLNDSLGEGDFYKATFNEGTWDVEHLEPPFNTADFEWDPLVSPDGSYMIFESKRAEGYGGTDIYVSFKSGDDWGAPINLGATINTPAYETAANITPDGKYIFYTLVPDKGAPRIYWVSTKVITRMKP